MLPGHVFTVEPSVNEFWGGSRLLADGWTAVTVDGGRSAQCEHTVVVTEQVGWRGLTSGWAQLEFALCVLARQPPSPAAAQTCTHEPHYACASTPTHTHVHTSAGCGGADSPYDHSCVNVTVLQLMAVEAN